MKNWQHLAEYYLLDCNYRGLAHDTIKSKNNTIHLFVRWVSKQGEDFDARKFFVELREQGAKPLTLSTYHSRLKVWFDFLVKEGELEASPLAKIPRPKMTQDQINPFTKEQIEALLLLAKSERDRAMILFMVDTGVRVSELCGLKVKDVDMANRRAVVLGKGNKFRAVHFGVRTARAIWPLVHKSEPENPLFTSMFGGHLGRTAPFQMLKKLAKRAKITNVRCSPHTMRHTFAIMFLRNGGNIFALKELLGHADLKMCMKYLAISEADTADQHKKFSPGDSLKKK